MELSEHRIERYSRQIILPEIGGRGQQTLLGSRFVVAGTGQVAALVAAQLTATGVGQVDLCPGDAAGGPEVGLAMLAEIDPSLSHGTTDLPVSDRAAVRWAAEYDLILDADAETDIRLRLYRAATLARRPLIRADLSSSVGWVGVYGGPARGAPCALCGEPEPATDASLAAVAGLDCCASTATAALASVAAVLVRLGLGALSPGVRLQVDACDGRIVREIVTPRSDCPICGCGPRTTQ